MTVRRSMAYVAVAALGCALLAWFVRAVDDAREAARSSQCVGNLKQIGFALQLYESRHGCFPPAFVADAAGKPLYSWRVLLMADLDRSEGWLGGRLAAGFRFDEPWNSPNNRAFENISQQLGIWRCPSDPARAGSTETHFVAVVGPGTMFPSDGTSRRLADVTDGPGNTLCLVEVVDAGIHWMEPRELDLRTMSFRVNDRTRPSLSSNHRRGAVHVVTTDDKVITLRPTVRPERLKALLTIAGGERIADPGWPLAP